MFDSAPLYASTQTKCASAAGRTSSGHQSESASEDGLFSEERFMKPIPVDFFLELLAGDTNEIVGDFSKYSANSLR